MESLKELGKYWDDLARLDPMWAICSDPAKRFGQWPMHSFFATGQREIHDVMKLLETIGVDQDYNNGIALDFGCGIGRLTQALAGEFSATFGVDISPEMVDIANKYNQFPDRCTYLVNTREDLAVFKAEFFDFIYTSIVLQHMPPHLMVKYLQEFVRILKPNGVLIFQVPVRRVIEDNQAIYLRQLPRYHPKRVWNALRWHLLGDDSTLFYRLSRVGLSKRWLYKKLQVHPRIDMYCLEQEEILYRMEAWGVIVLYIQQDNLRSGAEMISSLFVVQKPA